jgi:hypothetical protein
VWVGDFDFMGERPRVDDLALTLFFTASLQAGGLDPTAWRELAALVDRHLRHHLAALEQGLAIRAGLDQYHAAVA